MRNSNDIFFGEDASFYSRELKRAVEYCDANDYYLGKIQGEMESVLVGDAGTALLKKFEDWKKKNKEIQDRLQAVSKDVEQAATTFEEADNGLANSNRKHASFSHNPGSSGIWNSGGGGRC